MQLRFNDTLIEATTTDDVLAMVNNKTTFGYIIYS